MVIEISEKRVDTILMVLTTISFPYCLPNLKPPTDLMEKYDLTAHCYSGDSTSHFQLCYKRQVWRIIFQILYFALFICKYNKYTLVNFYGSHPKSPQESNVPPLPYTTLWPTIFNRIYRRKIYVRYTALSIIRKS